MDAVALSEFQAADSRRATSFVTNFGTWWVPADVAAALGADTAYLEWIHDTGELIALGAVPHLGSAEVEVTRAEGFSDMAAGVIPFASGEGTLAPSDDPGMVRELFSAEVVPPDTRVALLAEIEHGWDVHRNLWGWHRHHRDPDGWAWLTERLAEAVDSSAGAGAAG